jgi:hypothetical protein
MTGNSGQLHAALASCVPIPALRTREQFPAITTEILSGPAASLTVGESIPGEADTIEAQAGLQYLYYRGQTVRW